jgi:dTMP kinase
MKKKATFISIEGLEGSGKSSVIKFLVRLIRKKGFKVKVFREPGSTKIGEKIREILLDKKNKKISPYTELLLYLAARTQLIEEKLKKALNSYDFVICDRFFDSTLVYQGYALGLGKIAYQTTKLFSLGIIPDLTILLDTPVEEGLRRIKNKDRIESRPLKFHKKLREGYLRLAKENPRRIKIVDANTNLEEIFKKVEKIVSRALSK